jgi:chorismate mutase
MTRGAHMKMLEERRRQIDAEINQLMTRRAEIDLLIARSRGEAESVPAAEPPRRRRNVKKTVMELVEMAGSAGVTATEVVDRAGAIGRELDRGSVSSLLSKFKGQGALIFDGERYYPASKALSPEPQSFRVVSGA